MNNYMGIDSSGVIEWTGSDDLSLIYSGTCIDYIAGAEIGMVCIDGKLSKTKSVCIKELEKKRKIEQSSGVTINGVEMQTDKASRDEMTTYVAESVVNGISTVNWKKADGTFELYPIAKFKTVFTKVTLYVNDCFGCEAVHLDAINAASDPESVDISTGWPTKTITFV